jgi:homoserine dehydrogenase
MSARSVALRHPAAPARIALLGTGTVGSAWLERLAACGDTPLAGRLSLVHAANSRVAVSGRDGLPALPRDLLLRDAARAGSLDAVGHALGSVGARIVVDATASEALAERHAQWLAGGIHVVTACKLGQGSGLRRWRAIQAARAIGGTAYGDSATVGAGLPLLRTLRALCAGGERIHAIAGVLSGSLAALLHGYDGRTSFSTLVRAARAAGYTEPDPRVDLSGEDVRRKLLILARTAGRPLRQRAVRVESLLPRALAALPLEALDDALDQLDAPLGRRLAAAREAGQVLRHVAHLHPDGTATVGLEALPPDHPLAGGSGTDNRVAIWSDRYRTQPLLIQGPGAGAALTAAALLDDALAIQAWQGAQVAAA